MRKRSTAFALICGVLTAVNISGCGAGPGSVQSAQWTAPREPLSEDQLEAIRDNPNVSKIAPAHQQAVLKLNELGKCPRAAATGSICADLGALSDAEGRTVYRCTAERVCVRDPFPIPCGEAGC